MPALQDVGEETPATTTVHDSPHQYYALRNRSAATLACVLGLLACSGRIGDPAAEGRASDPADPRSGAYRPGKDGPGILHLPMRRLTREEYDYSVRDLLLDPTLPPAALPDDGQTGIFWSNTSTTVTHQALDGYLESALELAGKVDLRPLLGCEPAALDDACAHQFIESLARRAFRRPIDADDAARFFALYQSAGDDRAYGDAGGAPYSPVERLRLVVAAMLVSPRFLYRIEQGESGSAPPRADEVVALDGYELATRLSYFLWRSLPDDALLEKAAAGVLRRDEELLATAERMLDDARFTRTLASFAVQWLEIGRLDAGDKSAELFPEYGPTLLDELRREPGAFFADLMFDGDRKLETLLTGSFTVAGAELADLYGAEGDGAQQRIELDPTRRAGILSLASVMAAHAGADKTSITSRGVFIRRNVLCGYIGPPSAGAFKPEVESGEGSVTEKLDRHKSDPDCVNCHKLMDPIGQSFEHYDPIGRYRDRYDDGRPVDAAGELTGTDVDGKFVGAVALAERLATSADLRRCFSRQFFRFSLGREDSPEDAYTIDRTAAALETDIRQMILSIVASKSFRYTRLARESP